MNDIARIEHAIHALAEATAVRPAPRIFAGADGFIDEIIRVVDKRQDVNNYTPVRTIEDYARRLAGAAGKSTNVEFVVEQVKPGGNGPLMSEAFGRLGGRVRYVGSVGWPTVDPLFAALENYGPVTTIAPVAFTLATEFEDGKIMHGKHQSLKEVTWENLVARLGGLGKLDEYLAEADLVAIVNWTMLPFLTEIFRGIRERVAHLGPNAPRHYFFDLCDPEKRTREHLREALEAIADFSGDGRTAVLGLNEKESLEVCSALDLAPGADDREGLVRRSELIARKLGLDEVVIHPIRCAAAWSARNEGHIAGPYCPAPKLTTGAGDHFNGGYMYARVMGLEPSDSVVIGKCVSGFYVREGRGPSPTEAIEFGRRWIAGTLDPWGG
jgi:sugar/nucleoside kinase (ribokinase family)